MTRTGILNTLFQDSSNKHAFHQFWPRNIFFLYTPEYHFLPHILFFPCVTFSHWALLKVTRSLFWRKFIFSWCGSLVTIIVILGDEKVFHPGPSSKSWSLFPFNIFASTLSSGTTLDRSLMLVHLEQFSLSVAKFLRQCPEFFYEGLQRQIISQSMVHIGRTDTHLNVRLLG